MRVPLPALPFAFVFFFAFFLFALFPLVFPPAEQGLFLLFSGGVLFGIFSRSFYFEAFETFSPPFHQTTGQIDNRDFTVMFGLLSVSVKLTHSYHQAYVPLPSMSPAPLFTLYHPSRCRMHLLCTLYVAARTLATFPGIEVKGRPHSNGVIMPYFFKQPGCASSSVGGLGTSRKQLVVRVTLSGAVFPDTTEKALYTRISRTTIWALETVPPCQGRWRFIA